MLSYNHISLILKRVQASKPCFVQVSGTLVKKPKPTPPNTATCQFRDKSPLSPDVSPSRAVYETYCQCLLIAAVKRKTGGRFCSPPAPVRLRRTSSDTKRFTRTVREADSSIGWREDEQAAVSRIDRAEPPKGNKTGIQPVRKNSQRQSHRSCKPDSSIVKRRPDPILRSGLASSFVP
jgi:hypothetical protein